MVDVITHRIDPLVVDAGGDADDAAESVVMPMNLMTPSVHIRWRLIDPPGTVARDAVADDHDLVGAVAIAREIAPATSGMPSAAKKPGDTERTARADRLRRSGACSSTENRKPSPKPPASRHGTVPPKATPDARTAVTRRVPRDRTRGLFKVGRTR